MKALWLCLCLGLAACADTGTKTWYRADGSSHAPGQLESDKVACEREMIKPQATRAAGLDRDVVQADVFEKCMTRLGYTDSKFGAAARAPVTASAPAPGAPPMAPGAVASAPAGAAPAAPPPAAAAPSADCRKVSDLRIWLPLCP
jgi:hypothetical protein